MNFVDATRAVTHALGIPYGYTITIWSAGALTIAAHGFPRTRDVLLFLVGATLGFLAFDIITLKSDVGLDSFPVVLPAAVSLNLLPIVPATAVAYVVGRIPRPLPAFFAVGFVASATYVATVVALFMALGKGPGG